MQRGPPTRSLPLGYSFGHLRGGHNCGPTGVRGGGEGGGGGPGVAGGAGGGAGGARGGRGGRGGGVGRILGARLSVPMVFRLRVWIFGFRGVGFRALGFWV